MTCSGILGFKTDTQTEKVLPIIPIISIIPTILIIEIIRMISIVLVDYHYISSKVKVLRESPSESPSESICMYHMYLVYTGIYPVHRSMYEYIVS